MGLFTRKLRPKPSILVREGARNHCCIGETIRDRYNYRGRHGDIVECMECGQLMTSTGILSGRSTMRMDRIMADRAGVRSMNGMTTSGVADCTT